MWRLLRLEKSSTHSHVQNSLKCSEDNQRLFFCGFALKNLFHLFFLIIHSFFGPFKCVSPMCGVFLCLFVYCWMSRYNVSFLSQAPCPLCNSVWRGPFIGGLIGELLCERQCHQAGDGPHAGAVAGLLYQLAAAVARRSVTLRREGLEGQSLLWWVWWGLRGREDEQGISMSQYKDKGWVYIDWYVQMKKVADDDIFVCEGWETNCVWTNDSLLTPLMFRELIRAFGADIPHVHCRNEVLEVWEHKRYFLLLIICITWLEWEKGFNECIYHLIILKVLVSVMLDNEV